MSLIFLPFPNGTTSTIIADAITWINANPTLFTVTELNHRKLSIQILPDRDITLSVYVNDKSSEYSYEILNRNSFGRRVLHNITRTQAVSFASSIQDKAIDDLSGVVTNSSISFNI